MWIVQIETATGARLAEADAPEKLPALATNESRVTFVDPPSPGDDWDAATRTFVPITPAVPVWSRTKISKREFRNRLGQAVRLQILGLRTSPDPDHAQLKLLLEDMKETLESVDEVDLENPDTIAGLQGLAQLGLLTAPDVARIRAPSTVEVE